MFPHVFKPREMCNFFLNKGNDVKSFVSPFTMRQCSPSANTSPTPLFTIMEGVQTPSWGSWWSTDQPPLNQVWGDFWPACPRLIGLAPSGSYPGGPAITVCLPPPWTQFIVVFYICILIFIMGFVIVLFISFIVLLTDIYFNEWFLSYSYYIIYIYYHYYHYLFICSLLLSISVLYGLFWSLLVFCYLFFCFTCKCYIT